MSAQPPAQVLLPLCGAPVFTVRPPNVYLALPFAAFTMFVTLAKSPKNG